MTDIVLLGLESPPILTASELRSLAMIASGHSLVRIARRTNLSEDTIKYHLKKVFLKLGARGRAHAVAIAISHKLLPLAALAPKQPTREPSLTPAQHRILGLMAAGSSISQMADRVGISKYTVKYHLKHALWKLGARGRANAVALAACHGLLPNKAILQSQLSIRFDANTVTCSNGNSPEIGALGGKGGRWLQQDAEAKHLRSDRLDSLDVPAVANDAVHATSLRPSRLNRSEGSTPFSRTVEKQLTAFDPG